MNDTDKAAIRARLAAATPGPWTIERDEWTEMGRRLLTAIWLQPVELEVSEIAAGDANLIAHAPADLAALLAALDETERERDELRAMVAEVETTLANERGTGEPPSEGWECTHTATGPRWSSETLQVHVRRCTGAQPGCAVVGWYWSTPTTPIAFAPTAREAMRAADAALRGGR